MRYVKGPNRVQDFCSSQNSLTRIMWWGIKKPHQFKEIAFFPYSSQKMVFPPPWMHDVGLRHGLLTSCPGHQSLSCQHCLAFCSCSVVGCSKKLHPGDTGYKWGTSKPLRMQVNSCLGFQVTNGAWPPITYTTDTGQKSSRLTILVLICCCTFYLWCVYVADSAHLQL